MNELVESSKKIQDIIAKLYVVRDSCTGIIRSENAGSSILWFEGAAALLHQGINKLQDRLQISDQEKEGMGDVGVSGIQDIISKLYVLRDSCKGASSSENPHPHAIWFQGAHSILQEGIEQLQTAVALIEDKTELQTEFEDEDEEGQTTSGAENGKNVSADQAQKKKKVAIAK